MNPRTYLAAFLITLFSVNGLAQSKERIFYSSFSPQDWDIYLSKDSGKSFEKFTDHPSLDYDAVISPDGKWIVFTSERSGIPQLYIKPVDGDISPRLLLKSNSFQDQAAFSPDGTQMAFVTSHEGNSEIYIIPFLPDSLQDVSNAKNLTKNPGGDFRPAFSPDGNRLAFSSDRGHKIVPHPQFPFARQRIGDIYSMTISGGELKRLTDSESWDGSPVWTGDGSKIIFYSARNGDPAIFEMNIHGSDQHQVIEFDGPAVSPKLLDNGKVVFTTWKGESDFKIMQAELGAKEVTPLFSSAPDLMFNIDVHPDGLMVFHGGKYPKNQDTKGIFGFEGDVLTKGPDTITISGKPIQIFGVRRAFVAPPQVGNTLLFYDASDFQGFFDTLKPMGYSVFWLPILVILMLLAGIVSGIKNRKTIPFWKYLLFFLMVILSGITVAGIFLYVDAINPMSMNVIRLVMAMLTLALIALGWWFYKRKTRQQSDQKVVYRVSGLYSILFFGLAVFSLLCAVFINHLVQTAIHFYQVDYVSGEKKPLFVFDKEANTNPANFGVIDSKVTHDGKALLFTTGSFRGRPHTQGDIWSYDFQTKNVAKLSDSPYNDGFADLSDDGKLVFRSGRTGNFDIYLKTNGELINLTNDVHRDNFPAISKQGDKIVFASDRLRKENEYKTMDIFMMMLQADNSWTKPEKISSGEGQNAHAHFSPDGEWVIYTTEGFGINDEQALIQPIIFSPQMYGEIVAYNIITKQRIRLTHNKWEDGTPLWLK